MSPVKELLRWYRRTRRDHPWRRNTHPYRVWVSEIMLQQTRIETVIPYYRRFLRRFPSVRALAKAGLSDVLKSWEGLGYYARARNLHRAAKIVARSGFPGSGDEWEALPGVGSYTAAAIASITLEEPLPVVDGNVRRVVARLLGKPRPKPANILKFLEDAIGRRPGDFNQGMMELGQRICTPRAPQCPKCPVRKFCRAYALKKVNRIPARTRRKKVPHHEVAVGVCRKGDRMLVARRKEDGLLGGLWEFPGGKIRTGETPERALAREFLEEVGIKIDVGEKFIVVPHAYSHFSVRLHTFHCRHRSGRARAIECSTVRWIRPSELKRLAFPTANRKIIAALTSSRRERGS